MTLDLSGHVDLNFWFQKRKPPVWVESTCSWWAMRKKMRKQLAEWLCPDFVITGKKPDQLKSFLSSECQRVWNPEVSLHSFWNCTLKPQSLGTSFPDPISHSICPACHKHFLITWNGSFCFHKLVVPLHPGSRKHIYFPLPHTCTSIHHIRIVFFFFIRSQMQGLDTRVTICNLITVFTITALNG